MSDNTDAALRQEIWDGVQEEPSATSLAWKQQNPWLPLTAITNAKWVHATLTESAAECPCSWPEAFAMAQRIARERASQRLLEQAGGLPHNHGAYAIAAIRKSGRVL